MKKTIEFIVRFIIAFVILIAIQIWMKSQLKTSAGEALIIAILVTNMIFDTLDNYIL